MIKRTPLAQRTLPAYTRGEERMNMITHIAGGGLALVVAVLCITAAAVEENLWGVVTSAIYGVTMVTLYTMSGIYHGLCPGTAKKVMQVLDHCTIYFLIAGTYTPLLLGDLRLAFPGLVWGLLAFEWGLALLAATLTAIDLERYKVFSMVCYILMGWAILPFAREVIQCLTGEAFLLLLLGGISYTLGAVLYGLGGKLRWMHSVFHIFVVIGSMVQAAAILFYAL